MSRKKKSGARSKSLGAKSGMLTGLVIVSAGLIAGYQVFEIATGENAPASSRSMAASAPTKAPLALVSHRRATALDALVASSLEAPMADAMDEEPAPAPVVNRAEKRDREMAAKPDAAKPDLFLNRKEAEPVSAKEPVQAEFIEADAASVSAKPQGQLAAARPAHPAPLADSADVALFAADMPLPAKLDYSAAQNAAGARAHGTGATVLAPHTYKTGKAFGGLGERAFQKRERRCMTTALYFEARSEPEAGQIAVGQVVMNRVKSPDYPDTICGVVYQGSHRRTGCQFSFTCDGKVDKPNSKTQWERSKRLADNVLEGRARLATIGDATHYHATYVNPRWRHKMARLKQIGRHIFYKSPNISVTETYQRYTSGKRS